jgi:hypothetical protein
VADKPSEHTRRFMLESKNNLVNLPPNDAINLHNTVISIQKAVLLSSDDKLTK